MQTIRGNSIQRTTAATSEPVRNEKWEKIVGRVEEDLLKAEIELIPRNLAAILAKIHTGESEGGKGLFLLGNTGTGKTRRLEWAAENFEIPMIDATTLCDRMAEAKSDADRLEVLNLIKPRWSELPAHCCDLIIDDLGTEPDEQMIYGTRRFLMVDAIIKRHKRFPDYKTHFTSNLTKDEIRERYGERVWSRLNEMVTFVTLAGEDRRMRKG